MKYLFTLLLSSLLIQSFNSSFQATLFNQMNREKKGGNLIISPLSIFQALSLATNGARGKTQSEMLDLLQSDSLEKLNEINYKIISLFKKYNTIDIADAVMTRFTPLENFTNIAQEYLAPVEPLESVEQVNNWCSNKTHGKIDKILNELDPNTLMIILNAVYFKGEWLYQFHPLNTKNLTFYNLGNEGVKIDTMNQIEYFNYYEDKNVQAIELRFKEDYMSAIIILPAKGTDINEYIDTLSISNKEYNKIIKGLNYAKVNLELPKFELEFEDNLKDVLISLGMYNAFDENNADFTGLIEQRGLYIGQVIHKTYLKVFEVGCEAAAVTAIIGRKGSADGVKEKIYDMKVNRPFLFLLKNSRLPAGYDLVFMSKIEQFDKFYKLVGQEDEEHEYDEEDEDDEEIDNKKRISKELLIIIIVLGAVLVFSLIGLVRWKKMFCWRKKIKENELIDGALDFE